MPKEPHESIDLPPHIQQVVTHADVEYLSQTLANVVLRIQVRSGVDREEAVKKLADALGELGSDAFDRLCRLPGDIGTDEDI